MNQQVSLCWQRLSLEIKGTGAIEGRQMVIWQFFNLLNQPSNAKFVCLGQSQWALGQAAKSFQLPRSFSSPFQFLWRGNDYRRPPKLPTGFELLQNEPEIWNNTFFRAHIYFFLSLGENYYMSATSFMEFWHWLAELDEVYLTFKFEPDNDMLKKAEETLALGGTRGCWRLYPSTDLYWEGLGGLPCMVYSIWRWGGYWWADRRKKHWIEHLHCTFILIYDQVTHDVLPFIQRDGVEFSSLLQYLAVTNWCGSRHTRIYKKFKKAASTAFSLFDSPVITQEQAHYSTAVHTWPKPIATILYT